MESFRLMEGMDYYRSHKYRGVFGVVVEPHHLKRRSGHGQGSD
jgi:hypothetical protein